MKQATWFLILSFMLVLSYMPSAIAANYMCAVKKKYDSEQIYPEEHIKKYKFSVKVEEKNGISKVSRCSVSSIEGDVSCDIYDVDRIELDNISKIKKYYVFSSQFDVQIFPNLTFLENNGRGGVSYGLCDIMAP